jgi:hypothetical protein
MIGSLLKAEEVYYFFLEKKVTKLSDSDLMNALKKTNESE